MVQNRVFLCYIEVTAILQRFKDVTMQTIDKETTQEMFHLSDELYEVMQLKTQDAAYEVVQVTHDELIQYVVSTYSVNRDENMSDWVFELNNITSSVVFATEQEARTYVLTLLMQARLAA